MLLESGDPSAGTGRPGGRDSTSPARRAVTRGRPLPSKLRAPQLHVALVPRRELVDTLCGSDAPLVVISAPAGSGKTITLVQWAREERRPVGWLRLDAGDDDPTVFLSGVAAVLVELIDLDFGVMDLIGGRRHPRLREQVLPALGAALAGAAPCVVVMDDCHLMRNRECWDYVALLEKQLPPGCTIALAAREDPPLPLGRLRAEGEVLEIRFDQLALGRDETVELVRVHGVPADDETLAALLEVTEGWATGLHLALLVCRATPPEEWLAEVSGGRREIAAYLVSEVLDQQPPDVRVFLLETAILEELSAPLCAAVTGRADAGAVLARLAAHNVFVNVLDRRGEWYRYQRLFAELLRAHLEQYEPQEVARLHRAAAGWYRANGHPEAAVRHLLAAGDVHETVPLVTRACDEYLESGRRESARRLLKLFTEEQLLEEPDLTLASGWVFAICAGTPAEQQRWGHLVCGLTIEDGPSGSGCSSLLSSYTLLRAELARDGLRRQRDDYHACVAMETQMGTSWYDTAREGYGRALWFTGAPARAEKVLRALLGETDDVLEQVFVRAELAMIAAEGGRWDEAAALEAEAERAVPGLGLDHRPGLCGFIPLQLAHARLLSHAGDPGAMAFACQVADYATTMVHRLPWMLLWVHVTLAEVALEQGELEAAHRWSALASPILEAYPDAGIFGARGRRLARDVAERATMVAVTPAERRVLELLPTYLTPQEIAAELYLSHNTVKSHMRALYRKLGAATRAEAVARARELGLLKS